MKSVALLVGGTGFAGYHLANQLGDRYSIVATGRDHEVRDAQAILRLVAATTPAIVVNLASITTVRETVQAPRETYEIGFFGLFNLLEALKRVDFKGRLLHISSSEVYGFPTADELPLAETAPLRPMSPYSVAKAAGESLCYQWAQSGAFDLLIARPFTHIGPGQSDRFAVARFGREIAEIVAGRREPVISVGSLAVTRDLTDVRDVARAYDLILHRGKNGQIYNVCSGREIVMRDVLDTMIRLSERKIRVTEEEALIRKTEQQRLCGSYATLNTATGWDPQVPLQRTLKDVLIAAADAH